MCVIAYKPMNTAFMSKGTLEECFRNNSDGAGFMFSANGKVHIRKGFMNFNDFWSALKAVRTQYGDNIPYVMHFRISTQAGVNQHCCHPYPLSANMENLKKLSCSSRIGIAHNGIIPLTSDRTVKDYNDTMKFITDYATLLIISVDWWKNPNIARALKKLCESKLAILGSDNHVELIGEFVKDKGCYYSNETFRKPKYVYPKFTSWDSWKDEWEYFKNLRTKKYDFSETYCPLSMDDDDSYCNKCTICRHCAVLKEYFEEDDTESAKLA